MKFKNWFYKKLVVGGFPFINTNQGFTLNDFDVVINVSDEYYPQHQINAFWFPMNEAKKDVGLNSIYGAMVILFDAEKNNKRVYLHCHAGVNRSRAIQAAYYYLRTGEQLKAETSSGAINRLCAMSNRGYLPPKNEMEHFLCTLNKYLQGEIQKNEMMAGMLDQIKLDTIKNF
jgi:hypothetical protein